MARGGPPPRVAGDLTQSVKPADQPRPTVGLFAAQSVSANTTGRPAENELCTAYNALFIDIDKLLLVDIFIPIFGLERSYLSQ